MNTLSKLTIAVLFISLITFVSLFGRLPVFRKGPVGFLHRLIWSMLPAAIYSFDSYLTGGRFTAFFKRLGHYLMNENHPLVLIFFVTLLLSSQLSFVPSAFPHLSTFHRVITISLCIIPHVLTFKAVTSTSSYIKTENHWRKMQQYPYDHVLFQPGQYCRTCCFLKPARSKHCSICKTCVAKHDHHCVWVMNCLGKSNYAHFIGMLLSLALMLTYGGYLAYYIFTKTQGSYSLQHQNVGKTWAQYFDLWVLFINQNSRIGAVGMLATLTAPLAWGLFLYHVYLIWAGMTTNESSKWADWRDDIADGLIFKSERTQDNVKNTQTDTIIEPFVEWPVWSSQWLMRCEDGRSPENHNEEYRAAQDMAVAIGSQPSWRRVQSLQEVDNIYDLGFWDNLVDVSPI